MSQGGSPGRNFLFGATVAIAQAVRRGAGVKALAKQVKENRLGEVGLRVPGKVPLAEIGGGPEEVNIRVDVAALNHCRRL